MKTEETEIEKVEHFDFWENADPKARKWLIGLVALMMLLLIATQVYKAGMITACENSGAKLMEDKTCWFVEEGENICYPAPVSNQIPTLPGGLE